VVVGPGHRVQLAGVTGSVCPAAEPEPSRRLGSSPYQQRTGDGRRGGLGVVDCVVLDEVGDDDRDVV
jgi:hypothetical protein